MNPRSVTRFVALVLLLPLPAVPAQELRRFDVTASVGIRNANGTLLPGSNPDVTGDTNGCLVQILTVGLNGSADLPAATGAPGGDDLVFATTTIGKGIAPNVPLSGRLSDSIYPAPANGTRVYARVFNAPTLAGATRWGQSASFLVAGAAVMDISPLGLGATTQSVGVNPTLVDSDNDGRSDYEELVANTNPLDDQDGLSAGPFTLTAGNASVPVQGRAGRHYTLQRALDLLNWQDIGATQAVTVGTSLLLADPNPPVSEKAFYRVRVRMP